MFFSLYLTVECIYLVIGCFDIIAEESDISEKDLEAIQSTEINAIKLIDVGAGIKMLIKKTLLCLFN